MLLCLSTFCASFFSSSFPLPTVPFLPESVPFLGPQTPLFPRGNAMFRSWAVARILEGVTPQKKKEGISLKMVRKNWSVVITSQIHDDISGDSVMNQKSKIPSCLEGRAQSTALPQLMTQLPFSHQLSASEWGDAHVQKTAGQHIRFVISSQTEQMMNLRRWWIL